MLSRTLEQTLHRALANANDRHHEYATLEHLLLALTEDQDAVAVMRACGVDLDKLRTELSAYLDNEQSNLISSGVEDSKPTASFQRVLQRAAIHVQSSGREEVTGANVLVALFSERESHAVYYLQEQDMTRFDAVNYISHGIAKSAHSAEPKRVSGADEDAAAEKVVKKGSEALDSYCVNLNEKAAKGKIDPVIGREHEIERTIQILCRRAKNNPLYVGEPGVGKTAIAEGLAKQIVDGAVPAVLETATIFAPLDLSLWAFDVLATLRRQGPPYRLTPTELSRATLLTPGAMTNRVDRLEAAGLVRREAEPNDRRGVRVVLTKTGLKLVDRAIEVRFEEAESAVSALSSKDGKTLERLLRQVLAELSDP